MALEIFIETFDSNTPDQQGFRVKTSAANKLLVSGMPNESRARLAIWRAVDAMNDGRQQAAVKIVGNLQTGVLRFLYDPASVSDDDISDVVIDAAASMCSNQPRLIND